MFQKANLTSFPTARENVEIACELGGKEDGRQRARELLDYPGVANRERSFREMLSGGEEQRVAIARALANEPSLILADEPTVALESVRSRAVIELFQPSLVKFVIPSPRESRHSDIRMSRLRPRRVGLSRNSVYEAAGRGEIPHRRVGRRLLVSRAALLLWLGLKEREVPEGATYAGTS